MVLLENVIRDYGIENIKIVFMPSEENPIYKWLRIDKIVYKFMLDEFNESQEFPDTIYFRNDITGRMEHSIKCCELQNIIDTGNAFIVLK